MTRIVSTNSQKKKADASFVLVGSLINQTLNVKLKIYTKPKFDGNVHISQKI